LLTHDLAAPKRNPVKATSNLSPTAKKSPAVKVAAPVVDLLDMGGPADDFFASPAAPASLPAADIFGDWSQATAAPQQPQTK